MSMKPKPAKTGFEKPKPASVLCLDLLSCYRGGHSSPSAASVFHCSLPTAVANRASSPSTANVSHWTSYALDRSRRLIFNDCITFFFPHHRPHFIVTSTFFGRSLILLSYTSGKLSSFPSLIPLLRTIPPLLGYRWPL